MCKTCEFVGLLQEKDFNKAHKALLEHHNQIDKNYKDDNSNTCLHILITSFISWLKLECKNDVDNQSDSQTNKFLELITQMLVMHFASGINKDNKHPFDLFQVPDKSSIFCKVEKEVVRTFELNTGFLYSGRKYVSNLSLFRPRKSSSSKPYKAAVIDDKWEVLNKLDGLDLSLHQRLALFEKYLRLNEIWCDGDNNIAVASLSFVISAKPKCQNNEGEIKFVTIPISDPDYLLKTAEGFHKHSEDALCSYLKDKTNLELIVKKLKKEFPDKDHKIYRLVLDIHSTNEVCLGCDLLLRELQINNSKESFLENIQVLLKINHFLLPKQVDNSLCILAPSESNNPLPQEADRICAKLFLSVRLSAQNPYIQGQSLPCLPFPMPIAHETFNHDIKKHLQDVRLHLPPRLFDGRADKEKPKVVPWSKVAIGEDEVIKKIYNMRAHTLSELSRQIFEKNSNCFFYCQTAFINSGINNESQRRVECQKSVKCQNLNDGFRNYEDPEKAKKALVEVLHI